MKPIVFHGLAAIVCAAITVACGGQTTGEGAVSNQEATLSSLEQGAVVHRAYVGVTQGLQVGPTPVVGTFDLLGGADVVIEVATLSGAPVQFDLWQVHVDKWATLAVAVDATSGFSLRTLHADEDSSWVLRFPSSAPGDLVMRIDCKGGAHGCTPFQQPGQACPAGWQCDEGLTCKVPGDVCVDQSQ
jgi:hypothetical protein